MVRLLLVEDFEDAREMYRMSLEFLGFRVFTARDAIEGLEVARKEMPDLILMDAGLPGLSGWDAVAIIKADPRLQRIPLLMLTGHVLKESEERAARAGADGFIPKPCLPDELAKEIRAALAVRDRPRERIPKKPSK